MSYTPTPLDTPVVLQGGYTPPDLSTPVVLDDGGPAPGGTMLVPLVATPPAAMASVALRLGQPTVMAVTLAPPLPPAPLDAGAAIVYSATAAATLTAPIPPAVLVGAGAHDFALPDDAAVGARTRHSHALPARARSGLAHAQALAARARAAAEHAQAVPLASRTALCHTDALHARRPATLPHAHALPLRRGARARHADTLPLRRPAVVAHADALPTRTGAGLHHADTIVHRPHRRLRWQHGPPEARRLQLGHHDAAPAAPRLRGPWQQGIYPPPGRWWPAYEPPGLVFVIPCAGGYVPRPLACPVVLGPTYVKQPPCNIEPPAGTIIVPVREVYYVLNTFSLAVVGGQAIEASAFSARLDADAWSWSWSATVPAGYLDTLRPDGPDGHVEVIATINGQPLRLIVESLQRDRRFGRADLRVSGRSRTAWLAAPHAPAVTRTNAEARTAQQLINDALTDNGVPIGWTLDWQITDWLVPAGVWSHTGTYIEAATRVAAAAGAYIQPHDTDQVLRILPRYPSAPWEWSAATPDVVLPEDVVTVEGIEWADKPAYDAVYLVGTGILGHVTRAGSAGGTVAPMETDELLTHSDATLQRGRAILGDTGRQARIALSLPVLPETGIIKPGILMQYSEQGVTHRGITRGVDVQVNFPTIMQTVEVETHEPA